MDNNPPGTRGLRNFVSWLINNVKGFNHQLAYRMIDQLPRRRKGSLTPATANTWFNGILSNWASSTRNRYRGSSVGHCNGSALSVRKYKRIKYHLNGKRVRESMILSSMDSARVRVCGDEWVHWTRAMFRETVNILIGLWPRILMTIDYPIRYRIVSTSKRAARWTRKGVKPYAYFALWKSWQP